MALKAQPLIAVQLTSEAMNSLEKTLVAKAKTRIGTTFGKNAVYLPTSDLDVKADDLLGVFRTTSKNTILTRQPSNELE
ncbi:MAG: hypothetical protein AAGL23_07830 [Pseudomonadota bacterium]